MSKIDFEQKIIETKVLYWGGTGAGATASLRYIYDRTKGPAAAVSSDERGDGRSYDMLPLKLGQIRGFDVRVNLYTVPTDPTFKAARAALLSDVDALMLISSTTPTGIAIGRSAIAELHLALAQHDRSLAAHPHVAMLTHRDDPAALPLAYCCEALSLAVDDAVFEALPPTGVGVFDALKTISKLVLTELKKG